MRLDPEGVCACDERRVESVERCLWRAALVHPSRRADRAHDRARVGERHAQRSDRRLALHRVLCDVRSEAVEPEADVDNRVLHRAPLRRSLHLVASEIGERDICLGATFRERRDDVEDTSGGVGWIRPRTAELTRGGPHDLLGVRRKGQAVVIAAGERELRVCAVRALHADRVSEGLPQRPLAGGGLAVEQFVVDASEQPAQSPKSDLREFEDPCRLGQGCRRRGGGLLLVLERVVEGVPRVSLCCRQPLPRDVEVDEPRQSRERAVEGQDRTRASIFESLSITLMSA